MLTDFQFETFTYPVSLGHFARFLNICKRLVRHCNKYYTLINQDIVYYKRCEMKTITCTLKKIVLYYISSFAVSCVTVTLALIWLHLLFCFVSCLSHQSHVCWQMVISSLALLSYFVEMEWIMLRDFTLVLSLCSGGLFFISSRNGSQWFAFNVHCICARCW